MYNLYIFEDESSYSDKIVAILKEFENNTTDFSICKCIAVNRSFLEAFESIEMTMDRKNIYILDITLDDTVNGFQIAQKIRTFDADGYIIFLTSRAELTGNVFEYHLKPLNFIIKFSSSCKEQLYDSLKQIVFEQTLLEETTHNSNTNTPVESLSYTYKNMLYKINYDDILYIETHGLKRYLNIHTASDIYNCPMSLKEMLNVLPKHFMRCHKSYILNTTHISKLDLSPPQCNAYLSDNKQCPVSKVYVRPILETL